MKKISIILLSLIFLSGIVLFIEGCRKKKTDDITPPPQEPEDTTMVVVRANNELIRYSGRIDFSDPLMPTFAYPGVSMKAKFQGKAVDVIIKDYGAGGATTTNYYEIIIDGVVKSPLQVNATDTLYYVARNLSDGDHTIEVFKRTESSVGKSAFRGLRIRQGKTLLTLPTASTRKIEFIGNSLTCGYGNEVSIPAPPTGDPNTGFHSVNENNYKAWGAITCRTLNAQYMCTAYSGRGMYRNNNGSTTGTASTYYNRIFPDAATPLWDHSNYVSDVVVICLGTNDLAPESWGTPSDLDSASFVNAYISFVQTIRTNNPDAHIICIIPNSISDFWPVGKKWRTRLSNYIQAVDNHYSSDSKVHQLSIPSQAPPYGEDYHPSAAEHQNMANVLIPFIQGLTGW